MRRFFKAAFVVTAFIMNYDVDAYERLSISVKGFRQLRFFKNRDDYDNNSIDKSTINASFGRCECQQYDNRIGS